MALVGGRERPPGAEGAPRLARLGVLFSGGGRTLENLAVEAAAGRLPVDIPLAISSHAGAGGIARAREAGIPCEVIDYREAGGGFSSRIAAALAAARCDLIALAGFIRYFEVPPEHRGRVLNIHPALLPAFGGKGFYGDRVHRAVLAAGAKFSGCTVHFVSEEYDQGPIILQRVVPVRDDDTPDSLAARVFKEECIAYPEAIRLVVEERLEVDGARVRLRS